MPGDFKAFIFKKRYARIVERVRTLRDKIPEFIFDSLVAEKEEPTCDDANTLVYKIQQIEIAENRNPRNVISDVFAVEINELRAKGFMVWQLARAVKTMEYPELHELFNRFYEGYHTLRRQRDRLEKLQIEKEHPRYVEIVRAIARKNCLASQDVVEEIDELEKMIRNGDIYLFYTDGKARDEWGNPERSEFKPISDMARQMFVKKIKEDFESKGYVTKKLGRVLNGDIRNVGRAFWGFERLVSKVEKLEARLKRHARNMKAEDAQAFEKFLKDPDNYYEAVTRMARLEARLDPTGDSTLIAFYTRMIENYKKQGLVTAELERSLNRPLGDAVKIFERYDENLRVFYRIKDYLDKKRAFHFDEAKVDSVRKKLENPLLRTELEEELKKYERESSEFILRCEEKAAKMEEHGFEVAALYETAYDYSKTVREIVAAFTLYTARIRKLAAIRARTIPELKAIDLKGAEFEVEAANDHLTQPENYSTVVEHIIKAEESARPGAPVNILSKMKARIEFLKSSGVAAAEAIGRMTNFNLFLPKDLIRAMELVEYPEDSPEAALVLKIEGIESAPEAVKTVVAAGAPKLLAGYKEQ